MQGRGLNKVAQNPGHWPTVIASKVLAFHEAV